MTSTRRGHSASFQLLSESVRGGCFDGSSRAWTRLSPFEFPVAKSYWSAPAQGVDPQDCYWRAPTQKRGAGSPCHPLS